MNTFLLFLAVTCPTPVIINTSGYPWNDFDQKTLERAMVRCDHFHPGNPCVKEFYKYAKLDYHVVCSEGKK